MGWYIAEGIIVAIIAVFVSRNLAALISSAVIIPIIFWVIVAVVQMNSNPASAQQIAASTISQIISYFGDHLPGIVISDVFGTITGAVIGLFVSRE
jgi:CDP-diglyceride synthetase